MTIVTRQSVWFLYKEDFAGASIYKRGSTVTLVGDATVNTYDEHEFPPPKLSAYADPHIDLD